MKFVRRKGSQREQLELLLRGKEVRGLCARADGSGQGCRDKPLGQKAVSSRAAQLSTQEQRRDPENMLKAEFLR